MKINSEVIELYKKTMDRFVSSEIDERYVVIMESLESLKDDTSEIERQFSSGRKGLGHPSYWIAILRIMKMVINLRARLSASYDNFVKAYQTLNAMPNPIQDERNLLNELGDYLYRVDEILGEQERLLSKLTEEIHQGILETFGLNYEPDEDYYKSRIPIEIRRRLSRLISDMYELADRILRQGRVMEALERMRYLLLERKGQL